MEPINPEPLQIVFAHADDGEAEYFLQILKEVCLQPFQFWHVADGRLLLNFVELKTTHIIFLDTMLNLRTGLQCVQHIRSATVHSRIALVMYSMQHSKAEIAHCFNAGANLFIHAPLTIRSVRHRLHTTFQLYHSNAIFKTCRKKFYVKRR